MQINQNLQIFYQLLKRDFLVLKKRIITSIFEATMYTARNLLLWAYILVGAGLTSKFGIFYFAGMLGSFSIVRIMRGVNFILDDIIGAKSILYEVTLPINSAFVFLRKSFIIALEAIIINLIMIPTGLLLLSSQLKDLNISILKFIFIIILTNLLVAFAVLWFSSWIKSRAQIGNVWMRYLHTIWLFGCVFYSWNVLYRMYPKIAYLNLLNPVVYVMEGIRSSVLGPTNFLNYWLCVAVIILFTIFFAIHSIYLFKKRLDLV